jgi:hypothetical protein
MKMARKISCPMALVLFGLVAACSDTVPPAAQASASFHLGVPVSGSGTCPPGSHWSNIPYIAASKTTQQVTLNVKGPNGDGPLAVDGTDGAMVNCSVRATDGGKFIINATASGAVPGAESNSIHVETTLGPDDTNVATGVVTVADTTTAGNPLSSSTGNCQFSTRPTSNGAPGVAPGKVWASVTCTNLLDTRSPDATGSCDLVPAAVFVFENCAQ